MKKFIALFFVCIISFISYNFYLTTPAEEIAGKNVEKNILLKEGTYKVEFDHPDFRGWKAFLVLKINSDGKMEEITYDYINKSGLLKTKDEAYNKAMKNKNGIGPSEYCSRLAKNLVVYQNPDEVDSITGATHSAHYFKEFAQAAFKNAQSGNTATVYMPQPELIDPNAANVAKAANAEVKKQ